MGRLTRKTRRLRIVNMLSSQDQMLEVCTEEPLAAIQDRYHKYNAHTHSYTWKHDGVVVAMDKTLDENGIPDEDEVFHRLAIDDDQAFCVPELHVYFSDDLTEQ